MNRVYHLFLVAGMLMIITIGCSKNHGNPSPSSGSSGKPTMVGKWTIVSVATIAYDSSGTLLSTRSNVYTNPPNNFFTFNSDSTWSESLLPDTLADAGLNGHFKSTSDTTFILTNATAVDEPCHIDNLTTSLFVWRHRRATNFDGTIPGYLDYVFRMTK